MLPLPPQPTFHRLATFLTHADLTAKGIPAQRVTRELSGNDP
jgi:hypothetical protein